MNAPLGRRVAARELRVAPDDALVQEGHRPDGGDAPAREGRRRLAPLQHLRHGACCLFVCLFVSRAKKRIFGSFSAVGPRSSDLDVRTFRFRLLFCSTLLPSYTPFLPSFLPLFPLQLLDLCDAAMERGEAPPELMSKKRLLEACLKVMG